MLMKSLLIISSFILALSFSAKANVDCIYTANKSKITLRFTSPCFSEKNQSFIDSFVTQLAIKINRVDTSYDILVLVNVEHLYYGFSGSPDYFTSIGVDTLRELNSDFINKYYYSKYVSTEESKHRPLDINATNDKRASKKVGIKIIYNIDYRKKIDWTEVEKLIHFAVFDFRKIKSNQQVDTVKHYSWYVTLLTLDTAEINQIMGRFQSHPTQTLDKKAAKRNSIPYKPVIILVIALVALAVAYKVIKQQGA